GLCRLGWSVTVVTPVPGEFWISDPSLEGRVPPEVRVIRTRSLSGLRMLNLLKRGGGSGGSTRSSGAFGWLRCLGGLFCVPDTYAGWLPFATRAAARLCRRERFDAVYSTSPPDSTHLAARKIARRFSIPWVADFRDPWISLYLGDPPTVLHRRLHERMERRVVTGADRVLVTTTWHEGMLREAYPACRVERIPNGYDEDDFIGIDGCSPPDRPFTILHCGMLTLGRTSRPFLEGLAIFLERQPEAAERVRVVFLGARESGNEEWVKRLGLGGSVVFRDNLPHSECIEMERESHVLLLLKHDDERYGGLVPGKLYEYMGAGRPILAVAPDGEASDLVSRLRRGE
ncbi:MAG: glycosyltransferase, partial [Candidatus Krumholzibacteria bacterium]|nr:glycosyltransferase [Candidatus Krumholzibacteria bacterium]